MKKFITILLISLMSVTLCACSPTDNDSQTAKFQSQIEQLEETVNGLNEKINALENENKELKDKLNGQSAKDEKTYNFYSLNQMHADGFLSRQDLMSIAYYRNGGVRHNEEIMDDSYIPAEKTQLDESVELAIKNDYLDYVHSRGYESATLSDVTIENYYGTYNNCVIVTMINQLTEPVPISKMYKVCDVAFYYGNNNFIKVWKNKLG